MSTLLLVPLDEIVVFPNMNVTVDVEVGDEELVLLVPRHDGEYAPVGTVAEVGDRVRLPGGGRVVNRAIDWARARALRAEAALGVEPAVEDVRELSDELLGMLAHLSPEHRAVIVLRHVLGYSPGEIAELLGLPRGTVNSRLRRGLDELKERLGDA